MLNPIRWRHRRTQSYTRLTNRFLLLLPLSISAMVSATSFAAPPALRFDSEVAYTVDDNVSRAERDWEIEKDSFFSVAVGANHLMPLSPTSRITFRGVVRGEFYSEFDGLSNTTATLTTTYHYRASGTFLEPTYAAFLKLGVAEYDSELRDSNLYSIGVSMRKAFTDRISFAGSLSHNARESDSTVFDTNENSLLLNLDYELGSRSTTYLTYNYLVGDITSSSAGWLELVNAVDAINAEDVFENWFAYRVDGTTHVFTLGTNFRFNEKHSLDFSARWVDSEASSAPVTYKRTQFSAAYLARF
jgi:hypothetical protein